MPTWLIVATGLLLIALVMVDVLWSTVSTQGGGPLARIVSIACWKLSRFHFRRVQQHWILETNAVVTLVLTFLIWVIPMWLGWTLIFSAGEEILFHQVTGEPVTGLDRFYFSGMVLLTLGTGDVLADGAGWRLLSMLASLNGLVVITLTITYLLSIISAVIEKRRLALFIDGLGDTAEEIIEHGWDGAGFESLEGHLQEIAADLMLHAERHLAYPVLQYFHPGDSDAALPTSLAKLNDATTLLSRCVTDEVQPNRTTLKLLRRGIDDYIDRVELGHISEVDRPPPMPDLEYLRSLEIPMNDEALCKERFDDRGGLRRTLSGVIEAEGWTWPT